MNIVSLSFQASSGGWSQVSALTLLKGHGIEGDAHAAVGNPRQVLIVRQSTLEQFALQPGDLRENIVLTDGDRPFRLQSGMVLRLGESAALRIMFACEPCAYLETLRRGLSKQIRHDRGLLAMVIASGKVQVGDPATAEASQFPALSDQPKQRFAEIVARIPTGWVMSTSNLLMALGVTHSYACVIPRWLKDYGDRLPVHRIVRADNRLFLDHRPDQADQLQAEGVQIRGDRVVVDYHWSPHQFHPTD
jgi:alkylated DNA nucleotide flippase Atl1